MSKQHHQAQGWERPYAQSLCLRCVGCRFVLGKGAQVYLMCDRTSTRYPAQPRLSCASFEGASVVKVSVEGWREPEQLTWVAPRLRGEVSARLNTPLHLRELFERPSEALRSLKSLNAPASALFWRPFSEGEPQQGELVWSLTPARGVLLAWSDRALVIPREALLSFYDEL